MKRQTMFITQLPIGTQRAVMKDLKEVGFTHEDIQYALDSRLCDLEDTIDITRYTN